MASNAKAAAPPAEVVDAVEQPADSGWWGVVRRLWLFAASTRLTTVLVILAMIVIQVGTVAQYYKDMWEVIDQYFRAWISWIELRDLFPASLFPWAASTDWTALPIRSIPFPGGAAVGLALAINLVAAHIVHFRLRAHGRRLVWGLITLVAGIGATWLVIEWGHSGNGLQGTPLLDWPALWLLIKITLVALFLTALLGFVYVLWFVDRKRTLELSLLGATIVSLAITLAWVLTRGDAALMHSSALRILYQLIQAQIAALILLAAFVMLFQRRAGVVMLHAGVGLLMFGEFFVSYFAVEQQMTLAEGQTVNYTRDIRSVELAIREMGPGDRSRVIAVPMAKYGRLSEFARGTPIELESLPFRAKVVAFYKNSRVRPASSDGKNLATAGTGLQYVAEPEERVKGSGSSVDLASAYVQFTDRQGNELGTRLLSQYFAGRLMPETISADGKTYGLQLQFKQIYKPYKITLVDVRKDDYIGTSMPRNYSSDIRLTDPSRNVDFETRIWMNNPLRYAGETFYQSGYNVDQHGNEQSTLQVVKNTGWMIPYVACMICATGMLAHFFAVLVRFLRQFQEGRLSEDEPSEEGAERSESEAKQQRPATVQRRAGKAARAKAAIGKAASRETETAARKKSSLALWLVPLALVALWGTWLAGKAKVPQPSASRLQYYEFGKLPVVFQGRVKPIDSLARNSLRILSNRETFKDESGRRQDAIVWLLDLISGSPRADQYRVIRIDGLELLETFGLERRQGFRYAWAELRPKWGEFQRQVMLAYQQPTEKRTFYQRKAIQLYQRVYRYQLLQEAFRPLPIPDFPSDEDIAKDKAAAIKKVTAMQPLLKRVPELRRALATKEPPLVIPWSGAQKSWEAYATAKNQAAADKIFRQKDPPRELLIFSEILDAYRHDDVVRFNESIAQYRRRLKEIHPVGYKAGVVDFEAYFNHTAPFYHAIPVYLTAMLLAAFGWMALAASVKWANVLQRSSTWLILLALAVHTFALVARVIISGRPPVTNLYSSAVFIGWGCVIMALIFEWIFRIGVGNFVGAACGIATLVIAHFLAGDGDTIRVLQAVLDTQFWLTVHVLTVTLGYSATFLAGALGIILVALEAGRQWLLPLFGASGDRSPDTGQTRWQGHDVRRVMSMMIYGTICFAIFFSFVGTVLGGLWADDSWGRFWGWDPKENGALQVVLWNALVLHSLWSRMVRERGLALLAICGNIVTSWSWFGVNQLGVGLHAYGFTEGMALALLVFWLSQLALILLGWLLWRPSREDVRPPAVAT